MKKSRSSTIVSIAVVVAIAALLIIAGIRSANGAALANTAWSLLPPIIAIVLALITKEAYSALFVGVLVGDKRDMASDQRDYKHLADLVLVALVVGVDGDRGIA